MVGLINFYRRLSSRQIVALFTLSSIFFAWRVIYIQHGWVNDDFVVYYESARLFSMGNWQEGLQVYSWPFYPTLMMLLHQLFGYELQTCAQLISILLFGIATYGLLTIIRISNGDKLTIFCGAIILFSSSYLVGDVLPMLLRDPGAWAFFLLSLVFLVRFYRENSYKTALAWQLFAIIATLFRIEYITFLVLMPLVVFFKRELGITQRFSMFLKAQLLLLAFLILFIVLLMLMPTVSIDDFGRLKEIADVFGSRYEATASILSQKSETLGTQVLSNDWDSYVTLALLIVFVSLSAIKCLNALGWMNSLLLLSSRNKQVSLDNDTKHILIFAVLLSLLNALVIVMSVFLLSGRYTAPFALSLMILASFSLAYFIRLSRSSSDTGVKIFVFIVVLFMAFGVVNNLWVKPVGSNFQQDAVAWLRVNHIENEDIFFDDSRTRYYARAPYKERINGRDDYFERAVRKREVEGYQYLLVNLSSKQPKREEFIANNLPQYRMVKRFYGVRNKKSIAIYEKVQKP